MTVICLLWAFQLWTADGRPVNSTLYHTQEACQADADAWATRLEVPSAPCFSYQFCFPQ